MRTGAAAGHAGYFHETGFYGSDEEFLSLVVPFFTEGLDAGEPVVAAFAGPNQGLVRSALGERGGLRYIEGEAQYLRPAGAIRGYRKLFEEYVAAGATQIRVAGDVPHPGVGAGWDWWARYEAAVNETFDDFPVWGICPYDTRSAPDQVVAEVRRTHPHIATGGQHLANPDFEDPRAFLTARRSRWRDPLEAQPAAAHLVDPSAAAVRAAVAAAATVTDVMGEDLSGLLLGASEAVTNAILYGRPPVTVRIWTAPRRVLVAVNDGGTGPLDPYAGLRPVAGAAAGGLGLWLTHQMCSYVGLERGADGFTIRIVAGEPGPVATGA